VDVHELEKYLFPFLIIFIKFMFISPFLGDVITMRELLEDRKKQALSRKQK